MLLIEIARNDSDYVQVIRRSRNLSRSEGLKNSFSFRIQKKMRQEDDDFSWWREKEEGYEEGQGNLDQLIGAFPEFSGMLDAMFRKYPFRKIDKEELQKIVRISYNGAFTRVS